MKSYCMPVLLFIYSYEVRVKGCGLKVIKTNGYF